MNSEALKGDQLPPIALSPPPQAHLLRHHCPHHHLPQANRTAQHRQHPSASTPSGNSRPKSNLTPARKDYVVLEIHAIASMPSPLNTRTASMSSRRRSCGQKERSRSIPSGREALRNPPHWPSKLHSTSPILHPTMRAHGSTPSFVNCRRTSLSFGNESIWNVRPMPQ